MIFFVIDFFRVYHYHKKYHANCRSKYLSITKNITITELPLAPGLNSPFTFQIIFFNNSLLDLLPWIFLRLQVCIYNRDHRYIPIFILSCRNSTFLCVIGKRIVSLEYYLSHVILMQFPHIMKFSLCNFVNLLNN